MHPRHCFLIISYCFIIAAQAQPTTARNRPVPGPLLQQDFNLLKRVLMDVHPGLYRYNSVAQMAKNLDLLGGQWSRTEPEKTVLKQLCQFLAKIKCGHTCVNPFNLKDSLKNLLYPEHRFLPVYFSIINRKLIITGKSDSNQRLHIGQQIVSINGIDCSIILDSLLTAVKADGNHNTGNKYKTLEISSAESFSSFDMLYPLFFPTSRVFVLGLRNFKQKKIEEIKVSGVSVEDRRKAIDSAMGRKEPQHPWYLEIDSHKTAVLTMKNWFTFSFDKDWKEILSAYFEQVIQAKVKNLVIDLRDNVGGDGSVSAELLSYLTSEPILPDHRYRQVVRAVSIDQKYWPYFLPWGDAYKTVIPPERFIKLREHSYQIVGNKPDTIIPKKNLFSGKIFILVNGANSSATFNFIDQVRERHLATLIGQRTGGKRQGINSNNFVFLNLPHSQLRIDIPLVFNDPGYQRPEGGIDPDYWVMPNQKDVYNKVDSELVFTLRLIADAATLESKTQNQKSSQAYSNTRRR